jgi:hypothetical protein
VANERSLPTYSHPIADVDNLVQQQFEPTKVSVEQRRSPHHLEAAAPFWEKSSALQREGPRHELDQTAFVVQPFC